MKDIHPEAFDELSFASHLNVSHNLLTNMSQVIRVHQVQEVLTNYFPVSDPDEEPEGHQVPGRLLQRAARDPQEHVPQALRAGDHQL